MSGRPDDRVLAAMAAKGYLDPGTGATESVRAYQCRKCGRTVMRGLLAGVAGYSVTADPEPLTPVGEVMALLAGLLTYRLRWVGNRYEIWNRGVEEIRASPAGTENGTDVLVTHKCQRTPLPGGPRRVEMPRAITDYGDTPPF